jgi:hypothetical protein
MPQHLRAAERLAKKKGWTITTSGSGHLCWTSPNGTKVYTSKSPGGNRAHQNIMAKLRRAGLNIRKT